MSFKFKNGDPVRCLVTGFAGVVMARTDHLTGCNRYLVQPKSKKKSAVLPEPIMFDEPLLELRSGEPQIVIEQLQAGQPPG